MKARWIGSPAATTNDEAIIPFVAAYTVAHSGTRSLRISNRSTDSLPFGEAVLPLYVEPHSTYRITAWVKGESVHKASLRAGDQDNGSGAVTALEETRSCSRSSKGRMDGKRSTTRHREGASLGLRLAFSRN